ncbi:sigma factor G inhibitor Gin [Shimazuella alba]|uniref:Inhibitor of sigma-G Gin n=1 Tax=Shimazuella alba TaxID=2690964 RepID=A0A6I4VSD5_9BACL|nr:sigma factor G inhibitor Gin [Shimazuella alba]MXQ54487.1 inhibitor of sigma-G Gin [Shimazuella alba]
MDQCKEQELCIICEKERRDVLRIMDQPICTICEQDMVGVRVTDWVYDFYIARLKQIW